mmetsp:Transcript_64322/g.123787  ORF Transcript_64322/g.123787 Transcript_64322/m.123787 type:complete len:456 (+) Transcript_64322:88-1455(+)
MGNTGLGTAGDAAEKAEFVKADKMVAEFLGIEWGHLCPRFGYNHNQQLLLVFQAAVSFAIFQLVLYAARRMSSRIGGGSVSRGTSGQGNDPTLQELEHFSSMVDSQISSMKQVEHDSLATFSSGNQQQHLHSQSATSTAMSSGKRQQRPEDLQRLKEEFQQKITEVKAKWRESDDPNAPNMEEETDDNNIFHHTALLIAVYWSVQAILSYVVLCSVGISMIGMPERGVWQHYCLLLYAVSNCGILPSGGQAFAFLVDWWNYEALTTMPASGSAPSDSSYKALRSAPASSTGLPELAAPRYDSIDKDTKRRMNEVNEMKWKFVLMCLPQIVPVAFMLITHTIPFLFAYLWLTLIAAIVTYLFVILAKNIVRRTSEDPRERILRQAKVLAFVFQLVTTLYIHVSVQVMTRVYAGEWRHGGYFDSLWLHLLIDSRGGSFSTCPWFRIVWVIDTPLRWT